MAKQRTNQTFNEMLKELQQNTVRATPVETIEERRYFLIVCEGIRTEPNYFEHLKQFLPKHLLETIAVIGAGDNTIRVVERAISERNKRLNNPNVPAFDEVWAVFDKDDFPDERFNQAVYLAEKNQIESAHSNQAFELWYVLHFRFLDTAINRNGYFDILTEILEIPYTKNNTNIVRLIFQHGNVPRAINWAKLLVQMHHDETPSNSWPVTFIHKLVCRLMKYSRQTDFHNINCE